MCRIYKINLYELFKFFSERFPEWPTAEDWR